MFPAVSSRCGTAAWDRKKIAFWFTPIIRSHSSSLTSVMRSIRAMPAMLSSTSSRPNAATACSTASWQAARVRKSTRAVSILPPSRWISRAVSANPTSLMSTPKTNAPSAANSTADARPIPEAAPVTNTALPSKRPILHGLL